jgi:hypothetical protein
MAASELPPQSALFRWVAVPKSSVAMVRIAPIVGGRTALAHRSKFNADLSRVSVEPTATPGLRATKTPPNPASVACRSSPRVSITVPHDHGDSAQQRRALDAHWRCAAGARAPAYGPQDDRPRSLDDLPLDRRGFVPGTRAARSARCRLALVRPGSLDAIARHHAALTCCAQRAGSRAGAARRQRTLDAARGAPTLGLAGRRLFSHLPGEPVRRRGHALSV